MRELWLFNFLWQYAVCYPRVDLTPYNFLSAYSILKIVQFIWWYANTSTTTNFGDLKDMWFTSFPLLCRCDLGDLECGRRRPAGRHTAVILLRDRVQHAATPQSGGRLQPFRLTTEEQAGHQWGSSKRPRGPLGAPSGLHSARSKWTQSQLCKYYTKWSPKQLISSDLQPGMYAVWSISLIWMISM